MSANDFSDAELIAYLDECAPTDRTAAIEAAARESNGLRTRLAGLAAARDAGVHSLGEVWRRRRLTCPSRERLGSHLLGVLDAGLADYVEFHLTAVGCRWCNANVEDLRRRLAGEGADAPAAPARLFESSVGHLPGGTPRGG